jgi:hypothetical protein
VGRLIRQPATPVNREIAGASAGPALFPPRPVARARHGRAKKRGAVAPRFEFRRPGSIDVPLGCLACGPGASRGGRTRPVFRQLHPLVDPQVLHFMQVPLRTSV